MKYYVYEYSDPRTNVVFYVGKGTGPRMFKHLSETYENTENKKKWAKLENLRSLGLVPNINKVFETNCEIDAYNHEANLISKYGRLGMDPNGTLTNVCIDNRPPSKLGVKQTPEHTAKIQKAIAGMFPLRPAGSFNHSEETKKKIGAANAKANLGKKQSSSTIEKRKASFAKLDYKHSDAAREKISLGKKGKPFSDEHKKKLSEARLRYVKASKSTNQSTT